MAEMLTEQDLEAIGRLMDGRFEMFEERLVERMDVKFDAVQEQLDSIENRMVTMEKIERWETGLIERLDHRYVRR